MFSVLFFLSLIAQVSANAYTVNCVPNQFGNALNRVLPDDLGTNVQSAVTFLDTWEFSTSVSSGANEIGIAGYTATGDLAWYTWNLKTSSNSAILEAGLAYDVVEATSGYSNDPAVEATFIPWIPNSEGAYTNFISQTSGKTSRSVVNEIAARFNSGSTPFSTTSGTSASSWSFSIYLTKDTTTNDFVATLSVMPSSENDENGAVGIEDPFFKFKDMTFGQSQARAEHVIAAYCDLFQTTAAKDLDLIFAIDNSGSMGNHQGSVAALGTEIETVLAGAGINWRIGLVTSAHWKTYSYGVCNNKACCDQYSCTCRYFTNDISLVKRWLTSGDTEWVGAGGNCGTGTEMALYGLQLVLQENPTPAVESFLPVDSSSTPSANFIRANSVVLCVILGDADDQKYYNLNANTGIAEYQSFFAGVQQLFGGDLFFAGIICPSTSSCGEKQDSPRVTRTFLESYSGSIIGSILDRSSIQTTLRAAINNIVAQSSPYPLTKPSIGASLRVLMLPSVAKGSCVNVATNEIPRSRENGFDIDENSIVLFGDCLPKNDGEDLAALYFYWTVTKCGDGFVTNDGISGEECDPGIAGTKCCDSETCKFSSTSTPCTTEGGSCPGSNNFCDGNGGCDSVVCDVADPNFCDIFVGCNSTGDCVWDVDGRVCYPNNCNKRYCDRNVFDSVNQRQGKCVEVLIEDQLQCDTEFCYEDACGYCLGDNSTCADCFGVPYGGAVLDSCGRCAGDGTSCFGCDGIKFSPKVYDLCGVCGGDGYDCVDCNVDANGRLNKDECGVCNGDDKSCEKKLPIRMKLPSDVMSDEATTCEALIAAIEDALVQSGGSTGGNITCSAVDTANCGNDEFCETGAIQYDIDIPVSSFSQLDAEEVDQNPYKGLTVLNDNGLQQKAIDELTTNGEAKDVSVVVPFDYVPAATTTFAPSPANTVNPNTPTPTPSPEKTTMETSSPDKPTTFQAEVPVPPTKGGSDQVDEERLEEIAEQIEQDLQGDFPGVNVYPEIAEDGTVTLVYEFPADGPVPEEDWDYTPSEDILGTDVVIEGPKQVDTTPTTGSSVTDGATALAIGFVLGFFL